MTLLNQGQIAWIEKMISPDGVCVSELVVSTEDICKSMLRIFIETHDSHIKELLTSVVVKKDAIK